MAIKNKKFYGLYLNPENVDFLRQEYGDSEIMGSGLSGICDAVLGQAVRMIKFMGRNKDGRSRLKLVTLQEFFQIKEI